MESWPNGPHLLEFEPPDIFHCHVRAPIEAHEVKKTVELIQELGEKRGIRVFFVSYMETPDAAFTPGARKYLGSAKTDWKCVAIVGGGAMVRTAANLAARAMNLLQGNKMPFKMFRTSDEARAFIAELRAQEAAHPPKAQSTAS